MKTAFLIIVVIFSLFGSITFSKEITTGTISGKILGKNDESMSGGKILLFRVDSGPPPSRQKYWRTPDEIVEINKDGDFNAAVSEGRYYIAAIKRLSGELIGPPQKGDLIYPYSRNELKSSNRDYLVKRNINTNIGVIAEAVVLKEDPGAFYSGMTAIEGSVVDIQGRPVSGVMAFAYETSELIGKPQFTSARTGKNGKFSLRVSEGGKYYVKIRNTREGGHPVDGEIIGDYGDESPLAVTVKTGEVKKGIDVIGRRFDNLMNDGPLSK